MLILGHPQFPVQDDGGTGEGVPPIAEWLLCSGALEDDTIPELSWIIDDDTVRTALIRLRYIFRRAEAEPFSGTKIHDLALFVTHRLLLSAPDTKDLSPSPVTECIRYALILYMFMIQGPTYYSHVVILNSILTKFIGHLDHLESISHVHDSLDIWLLMIGMVASAGTPNYSHFTRKTRDACDYLQLTGFYDALTYMKSVCWLGGRQGEELLRPHWDAVQSNDSPLKLAELALDLTPSSFAMQSMVMRSMIELTLPQRHGLLTG